MVRTRLNWEGGKREMEKLLPSACGDVCDLDLGLICVLDAGVDVPVEMFSPEVLLECKSLLR